MFFVWSSGRWSNYCSRAKEISAVCEIPWLNCELNIMRRGQYRVRGDLTVKSESRCTLRGDGMKSKMVFDLSRRRTRIPLQSFTTFSMKGQRCVTGLQRRTLVPGCWEEYEFVPAISYGWFVLLSVEFS